MLHSLIMINMGVSVSRKEFIAGLAAAGGWRGLRAFAVPAGSCSRDRPNLRFGLLSDLHIRCTEPSLSPARFEQALLWFRDRGIDAVVIAGDMSDLGLGDELMLVAETWFKVFPKDRAPDGRKVERLFVTGNHESCIFSGNGNLPRIRSLYGNDESEVRRQLLRFDYAGWWERAFGEPYERFYHRQVNGYDFLCAHWDSGKKLPDLPLDAFGWVKGKISVGQESFGVDLRNWLDQHGAALDPRRPFFYQQHRVLFDTNYGRWAWNHDQGLATQALSAYPNAIAFAGDTHYSLTDERSIWQGAFTSVGTGSLRYTGLPDLSRSEGYENAGKPGVRTQPSYNTRDTPQGQLVSVYDDRVVFERRDFALNESLGDDWVLPMPNEAVKTYSFATRKAKAVPPEFPQGAELAAVCVRAKTVAQPSVEKPCVRLVIPPTVRKASARCFEYEVAVVAPDGERRLFHVLAEGFNRPVGHVRVGKATEAVLSRDRLPEKIDRIEVTPLDSWWNAGRFLTLSGEAIVGEKNA